MLGKGGVTHNTLDDIHNHWKKAEAVRIKCLGVPTLDMDNICFHLEVSIIVFHFNFFNEQIDLSKVEFQNGSCLFP